MGRRQRDAEAELNLPPGFRFHPTDEELVVHYLCRKISYQCLPVPIIAEVDLYKYDPWELPEKALFGQKEWYFFTPRDRKYPNGSRPNRAAGRGYWKATGADKPIRPKGSNRNVGIKKALVFYAGKAPKGMKTNWIMHEYRLADSNRHPNNKKGSLRLDDWVLCRLYNKKNNHQEVLPKTEAESTVEPADSFATNEDLGSDSLRTPESDVDNDCFTELDNLGSVNLSQTFDRKPQVKIATTQSFQMVDAPKEESTWFTDLNLEDLQSNLTMFGGLPVQDFMNQDYYFQGLYSPQLKPAQTNMLPF